MISRRTLLTRAATAAAGACVAGSGNAGPAQPAYRGPNVIVVRFGGGVRRRETINPAFTCSPWLIKEFASRGTLFANMLLDDAPHVVTSHGQGTLYLLTGRYDPLTNLSRKLLGERFEPPAPTLFEYLRRSFDVPSHQALIINGEDRTGEEFYTFSNHHQYGVHYRSEVLSMFRYKTWLLREQLAQGQFANQREHEQKQRQLREMRSVDTRRSEANGQGVVLDRFWQRWRDHYGDSGLVNARGDRLLTVLARDALTTLKPRLLLLNYQDPDYVHWGNGAHYTRGISIIDQSLRELVSLTEQDPFYRGNTCFVVVPDCGRDANSLLKLPFQHHFNSRDAHEIWALVVGPGVTRGHVVKREVQQIDVAATIAAQMGLAAPEIRGVPLTEVFA